MYNDLVGFISHVIKDATLDNISRIGQEIRQKLRLSEIPKQVKKEIISAIEKAGSNNYFAVRSSATAEDRPRNCFIF